MIIKNFLLPAIIILLAGCGGESSISRDNPAEQTQIDENTDLLSYFEGKTFKSVDKLEVGENASGDPVMGNWLISFTGNTVTWAHSDIVSVGTFSSDGDSHFTASFSGNEKPFQAINNTIIWDSLQYDPVDASGFYSQETLVNYLDGSTYNSIHQLDLGEISTGELAMGNWSLKFNRDVLTWQHQDVLQTGTYAYNDNNSSFVANFSGSEYVIDVAGDELTMNSVVYQKAPLQLFDSQESLEAYMFDSTFESSGLQITGVDDAEGIASLGYWSMEFNSDSIIWWAGGDTLAIGSYTYRDSSTFTARFHNTVYTVHVDETGLVMDSVRYRNVSQNSFTNQEALVAFLNGATYQSVNLLDVGELPSGEVAMGRWSIHFLDDTFTWAYQDIAEAGTYSYLGASSFTVSLADREYTITVVGEELIWNGVRYKKGN